MILHQQRVTRQMKLIESTADTTRLLWRLLFGLRRMTLSGFVEDFGIFGGDVTLFSKIFLKGVSS